MFAVVAAGLVFAGYNTAQAELQPARVVQAYCRDLRSENFSAAYGLLSSTYQAQVPLAQFSLINQLQDGVDGKVHACPTATGSGIDFSFGRPQSHVAFLITIERNTSFTGHIELNRQQNTWKVNAVEQSLQGSNVAPLLVADTFCRAIIQGNYVTAYHLLSSRQQSLAPESAFAQQFKSAFGDAIHLESCTIDYGSYHLQASTADVSMTFNLAISMPAAGSLTTSLVTVLNFTQESGSWKLDDFTPVPPLP